MTQHTIQTEVEVELAHDDYAYPVLEISYEYERYSTHNTLSLREAKLLNGHGMHPKHYRVQEWAEQFLKSTVGRNYACDCAEVDLLAMRGMLHAGRH